MGQQDRVMRRNLSDKNIAGIFGKSLQISRIYNGYLI
jgi:hypothetical protein